MVNCVHSSGEQMHSAGICHGVLYSWTQFEVDGMPRVFCGVGHGVSRVAGENSGCDAGCRQATSKIERTLFPRNVAAFSVGNDSWRAYLRASTFMHHAGAALQQFASCVYGSLDRLASSGTGIATPKTEKTHEESHPNTRRSCLPPAPLSLPVCRTTEATSCFSRGTWFARRCCGIWPR